MEEIFIIWMEESKNKINKLLRLWGVQRDFLPYQMIIREKVFDIIKGVLKSMVQ